MEYKMSQAACTGRHHLAAGVLCQDKTALCRRENALCAALADGAGSRARSAQGAACVTQCAAELLAERFEDLWALENPALAGELVRTCLRALEDLEPPIRELACTLLFFAAHDDGRFLSGHLGDGVQILVREERSAVFSPPENGAYLNETFFITGEDAVRRLRLRRGRLEGPGALLLMSDGMGEALYQRDTGLPAPACRTIARWLWEGDEDTISRALEANMERVFSKHSGDDLSLAVVAWSPEGEWDLPEG